MDETKGKKASGTLFSQIRDSVYVWLLYPARLRKLLETEPIDAFIDVLNRALKTGDEEKGNKFIFRMHVKVPKLYEGAMRLLCTQCGACCPSQCIARDIKIEDEKTVARCAIHENEGRPLETKHLFHNPPLYETVRADRKRLTERFSKPRICAESTPLNLYFTRYMRSEGPVIFDGRDCVRSLEKKIACKNSVVFRRAAISR